MPNVLTVSLRAPEFEIDRYGYIEELRARDFYARIPEGGVMFFNQDDVIEIFRCTDFNFAFDQIDEERSPYLAKAINHELLNMHGDRHQRLSRLVKQALRDRIVEGMREQIAKICEDLVDELPTDGEIDFCTQFADPLPGRILGPMFGVPYQEAAEFNEWIKVGGRKLDALQTGVGIDLVEDANKNMHNYLRDLLTERRKKPGEDLFSELILAEIDSDRMTEDELVYLTSEMAAAGVDTTRTQLPLILRALLLHPGEMAKLRAEPGLALRAVDEVMRFAPLPWAIPHAALHDITYKGIEFKAGDLAYCLVPAANRDPAKVKDPNTFNITRDRVRNFSFGSGMHACPGAQLARMEMSIALQVLIARLEEMSLVGEADWVPKQKDRGLQSMMLSIRKRGDQ